MYGWMGVNRCMEGELCPRLPSPHARPIDRRPGQLQRHRPSPRDCLAFLPVWHFCGPPRTSLIKHTSIHAYNASEHLCTLPKTPSRVSPDTCLPCRGFVSVVLAETGIIVIAFTSQMSFPRMLDLPSVWPTRVLPPLHSQSYSLFVVYSLAGMISSKNRIVSFGNRAC